MFGVRIPSQDNHSTVNMKMVDFLPVYFGSSAMFAEELIEISGADFDIDKVFAQIKEFYVKDDQFIEYGKGKNVSEKYSEYVQYVNKIVQASPFLPRNAQCLYEMTFMGRKFKNNFKSCYDLDQKLFSKRRHE